MCENMCACGGMWCSHLTDPAVKGPMVVISTGSFIFLENASNLRRPSDTVDLEELSDSCEHTRAPVLWLSNKSQKDLWSCSQTSLILSASLDRQGLSVAVPVDLGKNSKSFSPQLLQAFWSKLKDKNPKNVVMSPTVTAQNSKQKEVIWQQYRLCLAAAECQICDKHFLIFGTRFRKDLVAETNTIPSDKISLSLDSLAWKDAQVDLS